MREIDLDCAGREARALRPRFGLVGSIIPAACSGCIEQVVWPFRAIGSALCGPAKRGWSAKIPVAESFGCLGPQPSLTYLSFTMKRTYPHSRRSLPVTRALSNAPALAPSRISHADELQLACRLSECRRELLALALNSPACIRELHRIQTELATSVLAIGDVLQLQGSPADARETFEAWTRRAERLHGASPARAANVTPAPAATSDAEGELLDRRLTRSRLLADAIPLSGDFITRLIESGRRTLPLRFEARAAELEAEVEQIRGRFVEANQGLVHYVAQRYLRMGMGHSDIIQEGNLGLLRAIEKFDHRRGGRFGTYAVWWVRQGIRRAMANQSRTIRIPVHALGARLTLSRATEHLTGELGRAPTESELAAATGVSSRGIANATELVREPLSLDAPRGPDSELRLGDSIADSTEENAVDHASQRERAQHLRSLLHTLSPRERDMLRMRFGLDGSGECTLDQIGRSFAITRERVRQIVDAALQKLQRQTRRQQLDLASF